MNIIQKIKELNFPQNQYVVVGSGILDALGIRQANDIDIAVTEDLHQKLRKSGEWEEHERYDRIRVFLKKDIYEIIPQLNWENYNTTTEEAISSALMIEEIPFMNLEELIKFKTALGREKDFKDIELIKKYQEGKTNKRVRAVIIEDGRVLLMHRIKNGHEYWAFPGGGVDDADKDMEEALKRECLEELGVHVQVEELFMERMSFTYKVLGDMEYFYKCKILSGEVGTGTGPEFSDRDVEKYGTYEVVWLSISDLKDRNVYPFEVRDKILISNNISY